MITGSARACCAIMADQPAVGPVRRVVASSAGLRPESSVGVSPSSCAGSDRVRQAGSVAERTEKPHYPGHNQRRERTLEFRALLIATSNYRSTTLPDIPSAVNDVDALADALAGPERDRSGVETLQNPSLVEARQALSEALNSASRDTTLLVHIACHGIVDRHGNSFLALADTDPRFPAATALAADSVMDLIGSGNAGSVVVVLNACLSDRAVDRPFFALDQGLDDVSRPSTAFLGCTYARPLAGERHSQFTQALIDALRSDDTDPDGDGVVTVQDLYDQVEQSLRGTESRHLSYAGAGAAALPMASVSRVGLAERGQESAVRRAELGSGAYRLSWGTALDGFAAVEIHLDQFSVNWHTIETAAGFVRLCRWPRDSRVLIETTSGGQRDLSGSEACWLASRGDLDVHIQLVRYWLRDSSVAWQRLHPVGPSIVGVASDTVDAAVIAQLIRLTATTTVIERERELMRVVGSLDGLPRAPLFELREILDEEWV